MPNPTETRILDELKLNPNQTAKQIAFKFGWKATKASRYLGTLYFVNLLDRTGSPQHNNEYTYSIRQKVVASPKLAPLSFPVRVAGRAIRAAALAGDDLP